MSNDSVMVQHLEVMDHATNYRQWMYRQIAPFIGQRILEVGAGIGNFTSMILDRELVIATDKYQMCVDYLATRHGCRLKVSPIQLDLGSPSNGSLKDFKFDTVVCLNVLEHVEDDLRALKYMHSILAPEGRLILLVPAFEFLYGSVDRAIEHYRRYTSKDLILKMRQTGFRIEHTCYMNMIGVFGWFLINRILKREGESPNQIRFVDRYIAPWAESVEGFIRPPFGLSIIAVGQV